jgi:hypothetical protein
MIRKSVAILAVLGLCACGPELEAGEGKAEVATSQSALRSEQTGATMSVASEVPETPRPASTPTTVLPTAPTLPLDPIPLTVVRPRGPQVQLLAPVYVAPPAK